VSKPPARWHIRGTVRFGMGMGMLVVKKKAQSIFGYKRGISYS
jgi:hypothetical protein